MTLGAGLKASGGIVKSIFGVVSSCMMTDRRPYALERVGATMRSPTSFCMTNVAVCKCGNWSVCSSIGEVMW